MTTAPTPTPRARGRSRDPRAPGMPQLVAQYTLLAAVAALWAGPLLWMVSTSLKPRSEVFTYPPQWVPDQLTLSGYGKVLTDFNLAPWFRNSVIVALLTTLLAVAVSSLAAYPLARMRFRGRGLLIAAILATFLLPFEILVVPLFLGLSRLGIADSYFSLAVPPAASAFNVFLLMQFFRGLPRELEDAARVDGASHLRFFVRILLPLSKPVLATVAIFTFNMSWNNFFWPLIITNSDATTTLPVGIATLVAGQGGSDNFTILMSASVLSAIPTVAFFLAFQRYFVRGIATTGLK